jgi:hypothetical protein
LKSEILNMLSLVLSIKSEDILVTEITEIV